MFMRKNQIYGSGSVHHQAKILRKNFISIFMWLLYDFLSLKNDANVRPKSISKKATKKYFLLAYWCSLRKRAGSVYQRCRSPYPDSVPIRHGSETLVKILPYICEVVKKASLWKEKCEDCALEYPQFFGQRKRLPSSFLSPVL